VYRAVAVSYELDDGSTVLECSSPAVINDVWWRMNTNTVGENHLDAFGNPYKLVGVWNVDEAVYQKFGNPGWSIDASAETKDARADGFMIVRLDEKIATCDYHSYRTTSELKFSASITATDSSAAASSLLQQQGKQIRFGASCHKRCYGDNGYENGGKKKKARTMARTSRTCTSDVACKGCNVDEACSHLCDVCPAAIAAAAAADDGGGSSIFITDSGSTGNMYGGLACLCE